MKELKLPQFCNVDEGKVSWQEHIYILELFNYRILSSKEANPSWIFMASIKILMAGSGFGFQVSKQP